MVDVLQYMQCTLFGYKQNSCETNCIFEHNNLPSYLLLKLVISYVMLIRFNLKERVQREHKGKTRFICVHHI